MINYRETFVPIENLLFDPNNYRFQDLEDYVAAEETRFHEDSVQKRAYKRLRDDEGLLALKRSILTNGYVPSEKLIVWPYRWLQGKYVVIEGNRRLAAAKWLMEDYHSGVDIPEHVLASIENLPVVIAEGNEEDTAVLRAGLMGIRHVSGIKEWGGYQRAKLIVTMRDSLGLSPTDVAYRLGMTVHEVNRRYRAFKALQQMHEDEEYGIYCKPNMYNLFHEAVSQTKIKEWLGWDEDRCRFTNIEELHTFYSLISPRDPEETGTREPKITTYSQVRELRLILDKPEAKRLLLEDPNSSFVDALALAKQDEFSRTWSANVAAALRSLSLIGVDELKNLTEDDRQLLVRLKELVEERLKDSERLKGQ